MIEYRLRGAHPGYREVVPKILGRLVEQYSGAMLDEVSLYPYRAGDRSLANVNQRGRISLNPYWFAVSPTYLATAAKTRVDVPVMRSLTLPFHGAMTEEPVHVLTHEFGHCVWDACKNPEGFTEPLLAQARKDPTIAPAVYGLTNTIEYFAELFAAVHLGLYDGPHAAPLRTYVASQLESVPWN